MSKLAKLSVLLCAAWFVVVLAVYLTGHFSGNENDAFIAYLFAGIALINLAIWGYRWINSSAG